MASAVVQRPIINHFEQKIAALVALATLISNFAGHSATVGAIAAIATGVPPSPLGTD